MAPVHGGGIIKPGGVQTGQEGGQVISPTGGGGTEGSAATTMVQDQSSMGVVLQMSAAVAMNTSMTGMDM